jgi:hypothetical protein
MQEAAAKAVKEPLPRPLFQFNLKRSLITSRVVEQLPAMPETVSPEPHSSMSPPYASTIGGDQQ